MPIHTKTYAWARDGGHAMVDVEPGMKFPLVIEATVLDEPDLDVDLHLSIVFDLWLERYVVDRLEVRRRADGSEVSGTSIRAVRVQEILRAAVRQSIQIGQITERSPLFNLEYELLPADAETVRSWGPSNDDALRWVARIYRFAQVLNEPPVKAVQQQLGIAEPTASVWIRRARDRGILRPMKTPSKGKAAELFRTARRTGGVEDWHGER